MRYTSITFTWVKLFKRPEVNDKPTQFLNNGETFLSLDHMACSYQYATSIAKSKGIGFLETFKNPIKQKIILITLGIT